jgi:hypothetical protein
MKIVRGKQRHAVRGVIYGTEGIGKSTLAARFPRPLILDTEEGTGQIDCDRVVCNDWASLEGALHEIARDRQDYETVVVDSADWAERHIVEQILRKSGKRSIEDFGFGKGYTILAEHVGRLLSVADQIVGLGVNVLFVAHSKVQRTSPPDMDEGFDRYELKLSKQVAPLFKEWCDLLLFCNYQTRLVEGADGRTRAKGGKERVMYAERTAAWDAKNRFGLPASMPMEIDALAGIMTTSGPDPVVSVATSPAKAVTAQGPAPEEPLREQIAAYIAAAGNVRTLGKIGDRLDVLVSSGQIDGDEHDELTALLNARHEEIEPRSAAS